MDNELEWDKMLKVRTSGRDDTDADQFRYPYEPTPYSVLERLANSGYIRKNNTLIDYGAGKGRVDFFLSYQTRCHSIGVEYNERIFNTLQENRSSAVSGRRTDFVQEDAAKYDVPEEADRFYFFNPFSVEILMSVIKRIRESYYTDQREMMFFFYYPSKEYLSYLNSDDGLVLMDEISTADLFEGNDEREKIAVYKNITN
ncbi:MAG: class I SAM-dependent methyltransferase [Lachnospiraceae bacterium]|nr:class I SAM-dependent methyltransferase [Lachnospiraceae bacterium]